MFPVMLCVTGRRCLVVGGGGVALRKVEALVTEGADVTVVAVGPGAPLRELAETGLVHLEVRPYRAGEAASYALVFAATDERETNQRVADDAGAAGVWVNVADDPQLCSFQLPARVQRGNLELAVGSSGAAPFAVRRLRQVLERRFGPEWGEWSDAAGRFRVLVRAAEASPAAREALYDRFFAASVDASRLVARVPTAVEMEEWLAGCAREGDDAARARRDPAAAAARSGTLPGLVSLVGAGPGDPGLLTLRGRARIMAADAVVYDRLAAPALPTDLSPRVELHCVGKEAGVHPVPQEEINALLLRLAHAGKRVVRLKGGDPFVFGRGGEEAEALVAAGIPFEVVPGVTAGVAAPAFAGIPITHRRQAVRVSLVTAHEASKEDGPQLRWDMMAQDTHATIVGYMGVSTLPTVVSRLLAGGMDRRTPAAVIERAGSAGQRVVRAALASLPDAVREAKVRPPALFVIGPTVGHAERLDWFSTRPLAGERLVLVGQVRRLAEALELAGAETVELPIPITPAAALVAAALPVTGIVLGDQFDVDAAEGIRDVLSDQRQVVWCVGGDNAAWARRRGWRNVEEIDGDERVDDIVAAIAGRKRAAVPA